MSTTPSINNGPLFTTVTFTSAIRSSDQNCSIFASLFRDAVHAPNTHPCSARWRNLLLLSTWEPTSQLRRTTQGYHPSSSIPCESLRVAEIQPLRPSACRCGNGPQSPASYRVHWRVWRDHRVVSSVHRDCKSDTRAARERRGCTNRRGGRDGPLVRAA